MDVSEPVLAIQRSYPQIFFACHTEHGRRSSTSHRLSESDSNVLQHLDHRHGCRPGELAAHLGLSPTSLSATVGRPQKLGYVARSSPSAGTRRAGNGSEGEGRAGERAAFKRPPAEVWAAITDHAGQTKWRADLKSLDLLPSRAGRTGFKEVGKFGPVNFIVDESQPTSRYVVRILDENLPDSGRWIYALAPVDGGCRLTITEEGAVKSVMFRALSPFFSATATIESFLRALGTKSGETVAPEVVRKR